MLDAEIAPDFPLSGVLVPQENASGFTLSGLLADELGTMREEMGPFVTRYAALRRDLVPDLSNQRELGRKNMVAIALRELTQAIRHGHAPEAVFETVQTFTSNMPAEDMVKAVTGGGLRGFARNGGEISGQANFVPEDLLRPVASGSSRALLSVGKGGVMLLGAPIAGPAVAAMAAIVAVTMTAEHQRAEQEHYVRRALESLNQKLDDEREATRTANGEQLTTLFSRLIDGDHVALRDVQVVQRDVSVEFHRAVKDLERIQARLRAYRAGQLKDKQLAEQLGLDGLDHVLPQLAAAQEAIGHARQAFLARVAVAALDPSCVQGAELEHTLKQQGEQLQQAEALLGQTIESIKALGTTRKNWLGRQGKHTQQLKELSEVVKRIIPEPDLASAPENQRVIMIVDENYDVYVLDAPLDLDKAERGPELERLARAMRALCDTRIDQTLSD